MDSAKIIELGEFINKSLFDGSAKTNPAFDEGVILFTQQAIALIKKYKHTEDNPCQSRECYECKEVCEKKKR